MVSNVTNVVFRVESAEAAATLADRFVARDSNGVAADAGSAVDTASRSTGEALPPPVREQFEDSLGVDLSSVRVHTGAESAAAAHAVGAHAYAMGQDIHFAEGRYAPTDPFGVHLLAHEVAHTVQQQGGAARRQNKLEVSSPADFAEIEADRAADAMVRGAPAAVTGGDGVVRTAIHRDQDLDDKVEQDLVAEVQIVLADLTPILPEYASQEQTTIAFEGYTKIRDHGLIASEIAKDNHRPINAFLHQALLFARALLDRFTSFNITRPDGWEHFSPVAPKRKQAMAIEARLPEIRTRLPSILEPESASKDQYLWLKAADDQLHSGLSLISLQPSYNPDFTAILCAVAHKASAFENLGIVDAATWDQHSPMSPTSFNVPTKEEAAHREAEDAALQHDRQE